VRDRDQARARGQQRIEPRWLQRAGGGIDGPLLHDGAVVRQPPPRADVGLVLLLGDDDLVARLEQRATGLRQHVCVLRGRRSEMDFVRANGQVLREALVRGVHPRAGLGRGGIRVVGLDLEAAVIVGESLHHRPARVRASGVLEEGLVPQRRLRERRELAPRELAIEARLAHARRPSAELSGNGGHWSTIRPSS
jgi:hypothetical protein